MPPAEKITSPGAEGERSCKHLLTCLAQSRAWLKHGGRGWCLVFPFKFGCLLSGILWGEGEDGSPLLLAPKAFANSSHCLDLRLHIYVLRLLDLCKGLEMEAVDRL